MSAVHLVSMVTRWLVHLMIVRSVHALTMVNVWSYSVETSHVLTVRMDIPVSHQNETCLFLLKISSLKVPAIAIFFGGLSDYNVKPNLLHEIMGKSNMIYILLASNCEFCICLFLVTYNRNIFMCNVS